MKGGASNPPPLMTKLCKRSQPATENVLGRVGVPAMNRSTLPASPLSYSETFQPSRAAACIALRTGLGTPCLIGLKAHAPAHKCFIRGHGLETRPPGIEHALCHGGLGQCRRADVAENNQPVLIGKLPALLVLEVLAAISNLGVGAADALGRLLRVFFARCAVASAASLLR
jgi:hypothetical protein